MRTTATPPPTRTEARTVRLRIERGTNPAGGPGVLDEVADLVADALCDDPVAVALFPAPSARVSTLRRMLAARLHGPAAGRVELDVVERDGRVLAAALWAPPCTATISTTALFGALPSRGVAGLTTALSGALALRTIRRLREAEPEIPHWSLSVVAVAPHLSGTGLSRPLLEHRLAQLDSLGEPVHAFATTAHAVAALDARGFQPMEPLRLTRAVAVTPMYRPAT